MVHGPVLRSRFFVTAGSYAGSMIPDVAATGNRWFLREGGLSALRPLAAGERLRRRAGRGELGSGGGRGYGCIGAEGGKCRIFVFGEFEDGVECGELEYALCCEAYAAED